MAVRTVTTKLTLDGEKEFKSQMSAVNSAMRELRSEMGLSEAQFKGQANTVEALADKKRILSREVEQQEEKVKALEQAVDGAAEVFGEADKKTDDYRIALNKARAELLNMQDELDDTRKYLDEAENSLDGVADSLDEFGKSKTSGNFLDDLKDGLGGLQGLLTSGAIVGGVTAVTNAMFDLEESTREYRQIMGQLEASAAAAGYTAEETSEAYHHLYGVLGDTQATATTIANLQATGAKQKDLTKLIDACTGAWAKYGDSIPIDGLAEAINETVKAGQVTGSFADVLNWAGVNEDEFNEKLAAASSASERANIVMKELDSNNVIRFNIDNPEVFAWDFHRNGFRIADKINDKEVSEKSLTSFYLRKPMYFDLIDVPRHGCMENWRREETDELMRDFFRECQSRNLVALIRSQDNKYGKLRQLLAAEKHFRVAHWHFFHGELPDELKRGRWVVKSMTQTMIG